MPDHRPEKRICCIAGDLNLPFPRCSFAANGRRARVVQPETKRARGGGRVLTAETPIFEARHVSLRFGGVSALTDVSFSVGRGELFSIIGPNGAGKTSMVNCISGRYTPTEGSVHYK